MEKSFPFPHPKYPLRTSGRSPGSSENFGIRILPARPGRSHHANSFRLEFFPPFFSPAFLTEPNFPKFLIFFFFWGCFPRIIHARGVIHRDGEIPVLPTSRFSLPQTFRQRLPRRFPARFPHGGSGIPGIPAFPTSRSAGLSQKKTWNIPNPSFAAFPVASKPSASIPTSPDRSRKRPWKR